MCIGFMWQGFGSRRLQETYWDRSLVPLSTSRVSTVIPSMLMNSVAKVTSAESLASSFMASSRASILCDWILSISCRAALDWEERGMMPVTDWSPANWVLPASAFCQRSTGGQREHSEGREIPAVTGWVPAVSKSKTDYKRLRSATVTAKQEATKMLFYMLE